MLLFPPNLSPLVADTAAERTVTHLQNSLQFFTERLPSTTELLASLITLSALLLVCGVVWLFFSRVVLKVLSTVIKKTQTRWDDILEDSAVLTRLAQLPPLLVLYSGVSVIPLLEPPWDQLLPRLSLAAILIAIARSISAIFGAINGIYSLYTVSLSRPIKGFIQVFQVITYFLCAILVLSVLMDRSPLVFFTGLGAMTAVLMLVFRDTLLSLVAGVQLTSTNQINVGDWIEMPAFGADGTVIDIALNTVTVQNFDNTMTMIPAHKFLENSFRNWRSVFDEGARRIRRHLLVDIDSIRFLSDEELDNLEEIEVLKPYLLPRREEVAAYNKQLVQEGGLPAGANLRSLTNFGTFRAYVDGYLRAHPDLRGDLSMMVRHLQPTPHGIPLELYCFSAKTAWPIYEGIQADIFEHLIAVMPYFGLRSYQAPSGHDLIALSPIGTVGEPQTPQGPRGAALASFAPSDPAEPT